jgi:serine/threonine protein phosphatase 1
MILSRLKSAIAKLQTTVLPVVPEGCRIYAVGDIHGRYDLLKLLSSGIDQDMEQNPIPSAIEIYLGDFVDRGPESSEVIDWLAMPSPADTKSIGLMGNHEYTMLSFLADADKIKDWAQFGGLETLRSYGIQTGRDISSAEAENVRRAFRELIPAHHLAFLRSLKPMIQIGGYTFVHAGLRPGIPLNRQNDHDLFWIRDEFLDYPGDFGTFVVHGHTPVEAPDLKANRLNLDTGAYITGKLTCAVLDANGMRFLQTDRGSLQAFTAEALAR